MKPVADEKPAAFEDILAAEYKALRPDAGFESGDEKDLIARMHRDPQPLTALCISGGGIRSATFALGVIQGLAERGLLPRFDYLSTVSGGGYIGGWLTAWAHRAGGIGWRRAASLPGRPTRTCRWPRPRALPSRVQQLHVAPHGAVLERCVDHRRHLSRATSCSTGRC